MNEEPKPFWDRTWFSALRILLVFICTGTTTAKIGSLLVDWMAIERGSWQYFVVFIFGLLPIYNVILLPFAFIFGKFKYFRDKQRRTWRFLTKPFRK